MTYQVKWVSCKGRYTTLTFKSRETAERVRDRHIKYTGRPACCRGAPMTSFYNDTIDWDKGLLIGPLPHHKPRNCWVPDYRHPGVTARVKVEVDMVLAMDGKRR